MTVDVVGQPLYRRIQTDLRDQIQGGVLQPGSRLGSEQELAEHYAVSRATVRQALGGLVSDGSLEIRRGLGTFVRARPVEHSLGGFYTFSREIERHGMAPGTRVRQVGLQAADAIVAEALDVAAGTPVVALARLRLADDDPLVSETSYLPAWRFPGLERYDFEVVRLYETLTNHYGTRPVRAHESFQPVLLSEEEADLLMREPGAPALRVDRVTYDTAGAIVEYCRSTVRADRFRYSVELREAG